MEHKELVARLHERYGVDTDPYRAADLIEKGVAVSDYGDIAWYIGQIEESRRTIESLVAERDAANALDAETAEALDRANDRIESLTAERDALRAECERLRKDVYASGEERERLLADLHNARLGYKDAL